MPKGRTRGENSTPLSDTGGVAQHPQKTLATISLDPKAEKIRLKIKGKIHINKKQEECLENSDVYSNFAGITYRLCQQLFILHQYMVLSTAEGWEFL